MKIKYRDKNESILIAWLYIMSFCRNYSLQFKSERVLKVSRAVRVQGARSAETGVNWAYLRISSTAQRRNQAA